MNYVYADNFRGFSDSILELKKVNYFVGENSTGKTSIMAAVSLLSDPDFWFKQDFNSSPYNLGYYNDIVSKNVLNKRNFSIGSFFFSNGKPNGHIFKYCKRGNKPVVKEVFFVRDGNISHTKMTNKKMFIKQIDFNTKSKSHRYIVNKIIEIFKKSNDGFKSVEAPFPLIDAKMPVLLGLLYSLNKDGFDVGKGFTLEIPNVRPYKWVAPIRTKPKSIYESYDIDYSPEGDHTPVVLNNLLNRHQKNTLIQTIEAFGQESGLFNKIRTRNFGKKSNAPFEVRVTLNESEFGLNKIGYGVSQILPIIVDLLSNRNQNYAIQQPEVHLHPKAQAQLGEFIYSISSESGTSLLIETHSDYLIDRFRLSLSRNDHDLESQVVFFERTDEGNTMHCVEIDSNGRYEENQPDGFREFFLNEQLSLLEI